jgi:transposase
MKSKPPSQLQPIVSGPAKRRHYDAAFKQQAIDHYHRSGGSIAQVAAELGVNVWTFRDWIELSQAVVPATLPQTPEALQVEVRRLRQELERVTEQRDILKKSLGILSTT